MITEGIVMILIPTNTPATLPINTTRKLTIAPRLSMMKRVTTIPQPIKLLPINLIFEGARQTAEEANTTNTDKGLKNINIICLAWSMSPGTDAVKWANAVHAQATSASQEENPNWTGFDHYIIEIPFLNHSWKYHDVNNLQ